MIDINGMIFKTKSEAKIFTRSRLCMFMNGSAIGDLYIEDLIKQHPEIDRKLSGRKIVDILVYPNPITKAENMPHVVLVLDDKSFEDISWKNCIDKRIKSDTVLLTQAMRRSIASQAIRFKAINDKKECENCKTTNVPLEIDHINEFSSIRDEFLKSRSDIPCEFDSNVAGGAEFKPRDAIFVQDWVNYHFAAARLALLCKPCHKIKTKSIYNKS